MLETRWYAQLGIPAFAYGAGRLDVSHGPDEYVDEAAMRRCAAVYALFAAETAWRRLRAVHDDGHFGEHVAATYDDESEEMFQPAAIDPVVDLLVELAGGGRALELGIGTGRIAVPLAQRGVPVHGIDLSRAMVARLRAKPGAEADRRDRSATSRRRPSRARSRVAYLVFNTIKNLTTQAEQVACFRNVGRAPRARRHAS